MVLSPSYTWAETDTTVTITAQCPGATSAGTDVFSSPHYVSLNAPPYFLELDLHGQVSSGESVATVRRGAVTLKLRKAAPGAWGRLLVDLPRLERLKRRAASRATAEEETAALADRKKSKTWNESRYTLQEQMDVDRASREAIEQAKAKEKADEAHKIRQWQHSVGRDPMATARPAGRLAAAAAQPSAAAAKRSAGAIFDEEAEEEPRIVELDYVPPLLDEQTDAPPTHGKPARAAPPAAKPPAPAAAPLPPPRRTGAVAIKFTPKLLPAPARTRGAEADRALPPDPLLAPGLAASPTGEGDISQRDPAWLKARGDRFYSGRDWASAESAYTHVLEQFGTAIMGQAIDCVVGCYSNRAGCRLRMGKPLLSAADASHGLGIMSKARCVTEFPKSEELLQRRRLRLYSRRAAAYAAAGALHRAGADLHQAAALVAGSRDPSSVSDAQMLKEDLAAVGEREAAAAAARGEAAALMEQHQSRGAGPEGAECQMEGEAEAGLRRALLLLDECVALQASDAPTRASRAACLLWLGEARRSVGDATAGLDELDAEDQRTASETAMLTGLFPAAPPPEPVADALRARAAAAPGVRFELLRIRAAARQRLGQLSAAADDLKAAVRLRPAEPRVMHSLDLLARRAAAEGVELDSLPAAPPPMPEPPPPAEPDLVEGGAEAVAAAGGACAGEAGGHSSTLPAVGTRTAVQIKKSADNAVAAGRLEAAVGLYGEALTADASAEWLQGVAVGGLLFRCQCLANRAACHLRLQQHTQCVDDAGAALAALGGGGADAAARGLRLKLLARRGMALCQLMRYDEAAEDYAAAVQMDPEDVQLKHDLAAIQAARGARK